MLKIAVINGLLFINEKFIKGSLFIKNNKIVKVVVGEISEKRLAGYKIIDARNSYVSYGFIDPHVHFRVPGNEHKEDWQSGSKAAIKGGFTYVIDMPNNNPPAVDIETIRYKNEISKDSPVNHGFHIGLTDKNANNIKSFFKLLKKQKINVFGIKTFIGSSTGNLLIKNNTSIYEALKSSVITLFHCEDEDVLENYKDIKYNSIYDHNKKRPPEAAVSGINKIISEAEKAGKKSIMYICHVSSKDEIEAIKKARDRGFNIIAEVTPHHLYFNTSNISNSSIYKVNPPIREYQDTTFLQNEFNKGFFQIIGTDHAPHLRREKDALDPPSGFPGLESAFYALYSLYQRELLKLEIIFKLLTGGYKIFDIKKRGELKKGNFADITVIKKERFTFDEKNTFTKADFSPFDGLTADCKIDTVIINGRIVLEDGNLL